MRTRGKWYNEKGELDPTPEGIAEWEAAIGKVIAAQAALKQVREWEEKYRTPNGVYRRKAPKWP